MKNFGGSDNEQEPEYSDLPKVLTFVSELSSDKDNDEQRNKDLMGEGISTNISIKPMKPSLFSSVKVSRENSRDSIDMINDATGKTRPSLKKEWSGKT